MHITGLSALRAVLPCFLLAACGSSPPHAAPANPVAEPGNQQVEVTWNAVPEASRYLLQWGSGAGTDFPNQVTGLTETRFLHTGLTNFVRYRYRIFAETGGGRGPASLVVTAEPGPVPGSVEWTAVLMSGNDHVIHFAPATDALRYRVYFAPAVDALQGRRPNANFVEATTSPFTRTGAGLRTPSYYRVIGVNGDRLGTDGPVATTVALGITTHDVPALAPALGDPDADKCLDLPSAKGDCRGALAAVNLTNAGLGGLVAAGRTNGDSRFADFNADKRADLVSSTLSRADNAASRALLHLNQGTGNFQESAGFTALGIGGFSGTLVTADFDNDGDLDVFLPQDLTQGDGARHWLLLNNGAGVFTDGTAAAGLAGGPAGADYVPKGGQAADWNGDGWVDLLFGSRLMLNDGDGTFSDAGAAAGIPVRADEGLRLFDVDLDGDLDLLHHDGAVTRLHRNAGGVLGAGTIVNQDTSQATFGRGLSVCDVNSDGFEDVVIAYNATATGTGVPRMLVNVNGQLLSSRVPDGNAAANDLVALNGALACGDVDDNGVADVVARWGTNYRLLRGIAGQPAVIRLRVLGSGGEQNQQGRLVRLIPRSAPGRVITRVVESGSGLRSQGQYDLLVGAPWTGTYDVSVRFRNGTVSGTAKPGDSLTIFEDGRVETGLK